MTTPAKPPLGFPRLGQQDHYEILDLRNLPILVNSRQLTIKVMTVTPEIALHILDEYNVNNRNKKPRRIVAYRKEMETGRWGITGDSIKFSDANRLVDGQNRLSACVEYGSAFDTVVVFGVAQEMFDRIDGGMPRSAGDIMKIREFKEPAAYAAAVRWTYLFLHDQAHARTTLGPAEIGRLAHDTYDIPRMENAVAWSRRIYQMTGHPRGPIAALLYLVGGRHPTRAEQFAEAWAAGKWAREYRSLQLLRDALERMRALSHGRMHETVVAAMIVTAWNLSFTRTRATKADFMWSMTEEFPAIAGLEEELKPDTRTPLQKHADGKKSPGESTHP